VHRHSSFTPTGAAESAGTAGAAAAIYNLLAQQGEVRFMRNETEDLGGCGGSCEGVVTDGVKGATARYEKGRRQGMIRKGARGSRGRWQDMRKGDSSE